MPVSRFSLIARDIYSSIPPNPQTFLEENPTILMCWWCTAMSLCIILIRIAGRYLRTDRMFTEDKIMFGGIVPLVVRMILVHFVLAWGTNNVKTENLSASDIRSRETGSRLVLAARIFYAVYIWMAKYTVCQFLRRLTGMVWTKTFQIALRSIEYLLASTLAVVIIATLVECRPFNHYWQVVPDPGPHCRLGYANLLAMGVCDISTDIFLVVLPVSLFLTSAMSVKRKIQLALLFSSSLILVAITGYRVPSVIRKDGLQSFRSLVASFEILAATSVSNFVVIGSFLRDRGLKRAKYARYKRTEGSISAIDSVDCTSVRRGTITKSHWGSDADLADGLGIRLDPDLHATQTNIMRPAPVAQGANGREINSRGSSLDTTKIVPQFADINKPAIRKALPRGVSFYDVGGLLDDSTLPPHQPTENPDIPLQETGASQAPDSCPYPAFSLQHSQMPEGTEEGSGLFLRDVGDLITLQDDVSTATSKKSSQNDSIV